MSFNDKVVTHVMLANELVKRATADAETAKKEAASVKQAAENTTPPLKEDAIKAAADALITSGRVREDQRDKVIKGLQDPNNAVALVTKLASLPVADATDMGREVSASSRYARRTCDGPVTDYDSTPAGAAFRDRIMGK